MISLAESSVRVKVLKCVPLSPHTLSVFTYCLMVCGSPCEPPPLPPVWLSLSGGNKKATDPVSGLCYFMEMLKGSLFHIDHTRELAKCGVNWVLWNSKPSGLKAF